MGSSLFYAPEPTPKRTYLGDELKRALAPRLWGDDGSLSNGIAYFDESHILYLQGIMDAGIEEAAVLIDAINKYGTIQIGRES